MKKILVALALLLTLGTGHVFAKPPTSKPPVAGPKITATPTPTGTQNSPTATPTPSNQRRLPPGRLVSCQAKERAIQKRLKSLQEFAATMLETFNKISARVQAYYKDTLASQGKTVPEYDALVTTIQTKQGVVTKNLETAKNDAENFSCDGIDPKGNLIQFRTDMKEVKSALKDYRTAIKNLIVAVRGVASDSGQARMTPTGTQ